MLFQLKTLVLIAAIAAAIAGCGRSEKPIVTDASLPDDFVEFYTLFHHDTAYQYDHISFPLPGLRADGIMSDSTRSESYWTRQQWVPHRRIQSMDDYQQTYNILDESMIIETISEKEGPNAMQRRFALTSDGWQLIYYIEMQPLSQN